MFGDDEDEDEAHPHLSQPSARASAQRQACDMDGTSLRSSVFSFESCNCHEVFPSLNPPTTAWPQRHDEDEDFLALVRHNAAVQLETDRWPALKKRRVVKPIMDEQYTQALCNWGGHARGTAAPPAGMGQQDDRGPLGGMAAACLPTLALDADTATMAG